VSLATVQARIAEIQQGLAPLTGSATGGVAAPATAATATAAPAFTAQLQGAMAPAGAAPVSAVPGGPAGQAIVNLVRNEVGVAEQPPGSNDAPRIAQYRQATAGAMAGAPWCAYFTSWAAREAGVPVGESGQGFGAVEQVWSWGQRAGKAIPAGAGPPQPGDLIVWGGRHIGIVEAVGADGSIHTIEGNSSNAVTRRTYGPDGGGATGYVRLG